MKGMRSRKRTTEVPNHSLAETLRSPRTPRSTTREKQEEWTKHRKDSTAEDAEIAEGSKKHGP